MGVMVDCPAATEEDVWPRLQRSHRLSCARQVNKIEINYSKTAKKMDMKRLKSSMWSLLTESPGKPREVSGGGGGGGGVRGPGVTPLSPAGGAARGPGGGLWRQSLQSNHQDAAAQVGTATGGGAGESATCFSLLPDLLFLLQPAQRHGPEPVGTAGLRGAAASRQ